LQRQCFSPALARARPRLLSRSLAGSFSRTVSVSRTVTASRAVSVFRVSLSLPLFLACALSLYALFVVIRRSQRSMGWGRSSQICRYPKTRSLWASTCRAGVLRMTLLGLLPMSVSAQGREGEVERWREGERERGREGERERGREGERETRRERGRQGGGEGGRES